ncbi:peptide MFS transporter [Aureivirga marina]|uniref:peptide MFS transporter n=1 Tax=Aureivirga marina TaxID=1182451 RepID=UPI0018C9A562|nr:oligopeptide:H+ symporter [Aureivirga marina]
METTITTQNEMEETYLGHPKGLFYLFFAELWERFSFYGMKALLILYMTQKLIFTDHNAFGIFAAYMSLVYVTPLFGGMIADKIIGYRKAIMLGGILMAIGHFLLSFETPIFFYTSLAIIIVGNGFFKPNISSFVGLLYPVGDKRRDSGFTIFYLGVNVGGAIAPLICSWLAISYGWHFGFAMAGIGMLFGLFMFYRGMKVGVFGEKGKVPKMEIYNQKKFGIKQGQLINILSFLIVPIFAVLIVFHEYEHYLVGLVFLLIAITLYLISRKISKDEKRRLWAVVYFVLLGSLFWAIFEQAGSSVTLFASRNVNLIGINAAQTNSINSGFIMLLAIPFSWLWTYLDRKKINPNAAIKFGIGMFLLGLGFLIFGMSGHFADSFAKTPMIFLFIGYFVLTVGELFLSPIGLSKMEALSPAKMVAFIIGIWYSASFFGHFFAGKIAQLTTSVETSSENSFFNSVIEFFTGISSSNFINENFQQLYGYVSTFAGFGLLSMCIGVIAFCVSPWIKKLMV